MPVTGNNGDDQVYIGSSHSIGLSFYDEQDNQIQIQSTNIGLNITRIQNGSNVPFQYMNVASLIVIAEINQFVTFNFTTISQNYSIHIEIKPDNFSYTNGYFVFVKYGQLPVYNSTDQLFDKWYMLCPSDLQTDGTDSFFMIFANMSESKGFTGLIGYGIREMTKNESAQYCPANYLNIPPLLNQINYTQNFSIRSYTSGCYYFDLAQFLWSSYGLEVMNCTNTKQTCCFSSFEYSK